MGRCLIGRDVEVVNTQLNKGYKPPVCVPAPLINLLPLIISFYLLFVLSEGVFILFPDSPPSPFRLP